jgi:hypothetical protein
LSIFWFAPAIIPLPIAMMNARFAIACFFILFGLAQLWSWMQQFSLQQPTFIAGGLLLAIASNWQRRAAFPFDVLHEWLARLQDEGSGEN